VPVALHCMPTAWAWQSTSAAALPLLPTPESRHAVPRHLVILKAHRLGLTFARKGVAPMAKNLQQSQLPAQRGADLFDAIVLTFAQASAEPKAVCAHYVTPTAAIEDRNPCE
jgi:hypothetical protein